MSDSANKPASAETNSPPEYIAHYRILRRLGKGGMGEVFLGEDTKQHGRKVALKVLPHELTTSESRLRRFKQEARAILALNHPNILTVFEIGEAAGSYYIATEYIDGETLRHCLWRGPLKLDETLGIAIQVAMALAGFSSGEAEGPAFLSVSFEGCIRADSLGKRIEILRIS